MSDDNLTPERAVVGLRDLNAIMARDDTVSIGEMDGCFGGFMLADVADLIEEQERRIADLVHVIGQMSHALTRADRQVANLAAWLTWLHDQDCDTNTVSGDEYYRRYGSGESVSVRGVIVKHLPRILSGELRVPTPEHPWANPQEEASS